MKPSIHETDVIKFQVHYRCRHQLYALFKKDAINYLVNSIVGTHFEKYPSQKFSEINLKCETEIPEIPITYIAITYEIIDFANCLPYIVPKSAARCQENSRGTLNQ